MALAGACIVMTGLVTLSFIISQLHRFIAMFGKGDAPEKTIPEAEPKPEPVAVSAADDNLLADVAATAQLYQPLTVELGETFGLAQLYRIMDAQNLPHPHITVRELRGAGFLVPVGEGTFSWKNV